MVSVLGLFRSESSTYLFEFVPGKACEAIYCQTVRLLGDEGLHIIALTMERPSVAFSAPGKVLLAGGYLVLDRDYTGLVFGLDARIHVHVQTLQTSPGLTLSEIIVKSPQFRDAEWRYGYRETEENGGIEVTQLKG